MCYSNTPTCRDGRARLYFGPKLELELELELELATVLDRPGPEQPAISTENMSIDTSGDGSAQ
jgi:hypothetical protein